MFQEAGKNEHEVRNLNKKTGVFSPSAHETQPIERIDERLANRGIVRKGSDAELAARDGQVERGSVLCGEGNIDGGREGRDEVARDAIGSRLRGVGHNVRRYERVNRVSAYTTIP